MSSTTIKPKPYYTLLTRHCGRWGIAFGDYDRRVVEYEREDYAMGEGYKKKDLKIITTSATQRDIDAAVAQLNGEAA